MADSIAGRPPRTSDVFPDGVRALNIGLARFAAPPRAYGATVVQLDWRPPAAGDRDLGLLLARLEDDPDDAVGARVREANATAVARLLAARPVLVDVRPAAEVIGGLDGRTILHAGPPIGWPDMCGPMRGAVVGAALYEGWAGTPDTGAALAAGGGIRFEPCHHHGAVGPMAGILSPSMPVVVVENASHGNRAFATLNEGLGRVLRFGAYDREVLDRLHWLAGTLAPALRAAVARGPIDLKLIIAQALQMGDECHNRNNAATSLFVRTLASALTHAVDRATAVAVFDFLAGNNHFFLNLSMAACKAALDAAHGVPGSTVATAMARNGVEFGLRLSGTGDRWFTAPSPPVDGLYFPGYGPADANPDLGDSAITETAGIGGFAMAGAPAIVRFVGGTPADAVGYTREMYGITLTRNPEYALPPLGFAGTPITLEFKGARE